MLDHILSLFQYRIRVVRALTLGLKPAVGAHGTCFHSAFSQDWRGMGRKIKNHNTKHKVQVAVLRYPAKTSKHILTYSRYLHCGSISERMTLFIPTTDRLRGNLPFPVRSLLCINQPNLAPSEPYQPVNLDGGCNGSRVCRDSLLLAGQHQGQGE